MKSRKLFLFVFSFVIAFASFTVKAQNDIKVLFNEAYIEFDVPPQIIDGRTMLPMRKIFETLGAVVYWDDASKTATGKKDDIIVNISINSKTLFKNGVPKILDVAPTLIDGRTLVPVRAIAESFNCTVTWIEETRTVKISTDENYNFTKLKLSASEIADKVSPSVFYIEVYDENLNILGSGSGFFVSSDGVAVTNYHVIEETSAAKITTINGKKFSVDRIIAFDETLDIAIVKVNKTSEDGTTVSGFPSITLANSDEVKAGQTIYALGSPVGLQNTISNGIISNAKQIVGEDTFIQITAPISHGSSGGALVNEYGEVLGITSAGIDAAENIGFAIPINVLKLFDLTTDGTSYYDFASSNNKFTLEIYPETIELEIGESTDIYVYAEGKSDDWSIYWYSEQQNLVSCTWGEWVDDTSLCTLKITGINEGTAIVTVYSDVDFKGKDITISIKRPSVEFYPKSKVPTYTSITGLRLIDYEQYEDMDFYSYRLLGEADVDALGTYLNYLINNGFVPYKLEEYDNYIMNYYTTPDNKILGLYYRFDYDQVWIFVPIS